MRGWRGEGGWVGEMVRGDFRGVVLGRVCALPMHASGCAHECMIHVALETSVLNFKTMTTSPLL